MIHVAHLLFCMNSLLKSYYLLLRSMTEKCKIYVFSPPHLNIYKGHSHLLIHIYLFIMCLLMLLHGEHTKKRHGLHMRNWNPGGKFIQRKERSWSQVSHGTAYVLLNLTASPLCSLVSLWKNHLLVENNSKSPLCIRKMTNLFFWNLWVCKNCCGIYPVTLSKRWGVHSSL